jgi:predicted permease
LADAIEDVAHGYSRRIAFAGSFALFAASMHEYMRILGSVIPLFVIMATGAFVRRAGILNEQADRTLVDLLVHVLQPCLILDHVVASEALRQPGNLIWSPLLGFVCMALGIAVAALVARIYHFPKPAQARTFAFATGVFNYGYIPVPLIDVLYGAGTLGVLFVFNLGAEVAFWTVGFAAFQQRFSLKEWRRVFTTPVRAILLGVTINLITAHFGILLDHATLESASWGWPVKLVSDSVHAVGSCTIPVAMLLIGATMADFWAAFWASRGAAVMILGVLVRNVVCPAAFVLMAMLLPVSRELKETLVVQAATPAGVLTLLLVRHNEGDVPVALQVIFGTTGAALVTLPLWIHFGMQWVGLR